MTSSFKLCKNSTTYLAPYTEKEIGSLSVRFYLKGALMNKQFPHQDQFYYFNSFYRNYRTVNFDSKFIGEKKKEHTNLLTLENVAHFLCKAAWKLDCVMLLLLPFSLPFFHCSWWIWIHLWWKHEHHLCCAILYDPFGSLT